MRFLRRGQSEEETETAKPETVDAAPAGDEAVAAIEALAGALRSWGELGFDLDDSEATVIAELFEGWARHVLVAGARPGIDDPEATTLSPERDYPGVQRFVREHRQNERDWVTKSVGDLRQVIWIFVQSLGRAMREDRRSDRSMGHQIRRLQEAAEAHDTEVLKREALTCVDLIENVLSDRRDRQRTELSSLSEQIDEMEVELIEVKGQLGTDSLTGIHNRAGLDEHLEKIVSFRDVLGSAATIFMVDVDHFKWVNDKFGHPCGDQVLQGVAQCLGRTFRRKRDFVARYGGDEFTVIITDDAPELIELLGERLIQGVRDLSVDVDGEDDPVRVSISIGAATLGPEEEGAAWLERADRALYEAKEGGRDRLVAAGLPTPASPPPDAAADPSPVPDDEG